MPESLPYLADACRELVLVIQQLSTGNPNRPFVVALDGGSGVGKSTLAQMLADSLDVAVVPLDDFYATEIPDREWACRTVEERANDIFRWDRVREEALKPLISGRVAQWCPIDFEHGEEPDGTYILCSEPVECQPASVLLLEGAYSGHPKLRDLIDFSVLLDVAVEERHKRLVRRDDAEFLQRWHARWDKVEKYYFTEMRPRDPYDLVFREA